jgi:hypothetical protein
MFCGRSLRFAKDPAEVSVCQLSRFRVTSSFLLLTCLVTLPSRRIHAGPAASPGSKLYYNFNVDGVLPEAGSMSESWSPYWWLSSGGLFYLRDGAGSTIQGSLPKNDYWRKFYATTNPRDTDDGYHPQNVFRLVTRSSWQNCRQQLYFRIRNDNLSVSAYRNPSNGLLLMHRYQDSDNLYYVGVRVDGAAVIKKKYRGTYYTLGYLRVFPGSAYDRDSNPSLLPKNIWLGVRSEVTNNPDGTVRIVVWVDVGPGGWVLALDVLDNGLAYGPAITAPGYLGVRTDFMDVALENYWAVKLDE